jgi:hypothetical protein
VAQLVRSSEQPPVPPDSRPQARGQGQVLLTARLGQRKLDDPLLVADVGLIAGVFERSVLRLGVVGLEEARTRKLIQTIAERFELAAGRLVAAKAVQGERGAVVVEVLAVP